MARQGRSNSLRNYLTNLQAPLPWTTKVRLVIRNAGVRIVRRQDCCGHPGEPGC